MRDCSDRACADAGRYRSLDYRSNRRRTKKPPAMRANAKGYEPLRRLAEPTQGLLAAIFSTSDSILSIRVGKSRHTSSGLEQTRGNKWRVKRPVMRMK